MVQKAVLEKKPLHKEDELMNDLKEAFEDVKAGRVEEVIIDE